MRATGVHYLKIGGNNIHGRHSKYRIQTGLDHVLIGGAFCLHDEIHIQAAYFVSPVTQSLYYVSFYNRKVELTHPFE